MPRLIRFERGTKVWFYDGRIIYSAYVNKIIKNVPVNVIIVGIGIDENDNEINEGLDVFDFFQSKKHSSLGNDFSSSRNVFK